MTAGSRGLSSQTRAFLTLVIVYAGAFIYYAAGLFSARPARFFLGIDWSQIPVFLLLFTAVLLPALFDPGLDLFSYMNDRVFSLLLILVFFFCVLKYYSGAASVRDLAARAVVLLFLYALLLARYRLAVFYGHINKYALRIYSFLLTGLAAPYLAAGYSGIALFLLLLPAALFLLCFGPLFLAGRPLSQENRLVFLFKRCCRDLHSSPVPPAAIAFAPYLLAAVLLK